MAQIKLQKSNLIEILLWMLRFRKRYRVTGTSMIPLLRPGDHVLLKPLNSDESRLSPGDIVIARHPYMRDVSILKYISEISPDGRLHLSGLNQPESTDSAAFGSLSPKDILGRVTSRFPIVGMKALL